MKKTPLSIIYIVAAGISLSGCNDDVFISDYAPSTEEVRLSETDSTSTVSFKASNWGIKSAFIIGEDEYSYEVYGNIYGKDGHLISENSSLYTPESEQQVKMTICHPDLRLTIERTDATHLRFSKPENMTLKTQRLHLNIGNDYSTRDISIELSPSSAYTLDSITYTLNSYYSQDSLHYRKEAKALMNFISETCSFEIAPYEYFHQEYSFTDTYSPGPNLNGETLKIFGKEAPVVPVPEIDKYEMPVMKGATMPLVTETQSLPVREEMLGIHETVTVSPYKQRICRIGCWYRYFGLGFKIYASHSKSGEERILEGTLDIYVPQAYSLNKGEESDI